MIRDRYVYAKSEFDGPGCLVVTTWVDDVLMFYHDKEQLARTFKSKVMGEIQRYVGMECNRDMERKELFMKQEMALKEILHSFSMSDRYPRFTPPAPKEMVIDSFRDSLRH